MTRATRCEVCIYSKQLPSLLICRRFPPSMPSLISGGQPTFVWVSPDDWCGEYKYDSKNEDKKTDTNKAATDALVEHYKQEFQSCYGAVPQITVKDRAAAKVLAREHTQEQGKAIISEFLRHPPQWNKERNALDMKFIPSNANSILARGKGIAVDDTMSFLKTQADHRHEDNWFEYVDYVKKSGQKKTFEEWNNA